MSIVYIILSVVIIAVCILLNVMILMQNKKSSGLSGAMTGMASGQTYWDKNKGRSREGTLEKYSKIGGAVFMILCLLLNVLV